MDSRTNPSLRPYQAGSAGVVTDPKDHSRSDDPHVIHKALEQVLSSSFFRNTQQCQSLLRYIVRHSMAGEDHLLRERVIGSEVFGRRPDYEPGEDPVVRLRAAEVRKRLAQYYQSLSEVPDIHIDIPAGSYKAVLVRREDATIAPQHGEPVTLAPLAHQAEPSVASQTLAPEHHELVTRLPDLPIAPAARHRFRLYAVVAGIAAAVLGAILIFSMLSGEAHTAPFRAFWAPWVNSRKPVILAIGSNAVYRLAEPLAQDYARQHNLSSHGEEFFVPFAPTDTLHGSDLIPAGDSFVALGDVASVSHLVANLTRQKQSFQERFPNDVSFAELRNSPSVLVGGFNNPKTIELTRKLRFVLKERNEIDDTQDPKRRWVLNAPIDSHDTEDYAIVTRIVHWNSGDAPMLSVAGMGQYGTLAAADFICDPDAISDTVSRLPDHWQDRNLQLILHVKVVDFKVAATDVVAVHTW